MNYLEKYKTFNSVKEMDEMVKEHLSYHRDVLTASNREVLHSIASHALTHVGAAHLLASTIAKEVGISERTVMRSTKILTDLGIIFKYKTVKKAGQGASIYVIAPKIKKYNVSHLDAETCQSLNTKETHVSLTAPTDSHETHETVTKNLSTSSFNLSVVNNVVNTVDAHDESNDLKILLRDAYKPSTEQDERDFNELCKIAFGRLKQFIKFYNLPYLQLKGIILNCMKQLVKKSGVKNIFAMYSKMIERQVKQLFEKPVTPEIKVKSSYKQYSKEIIPDWFEDRNEEVKVSTVDMDFEAERLKILAKLG